MTAVMILSGIVSYGQQDALVGEWRVDADESVLLMDPNVRTRFDTLQQDVRTRILNAMEARTFSFAGDGSLSVTWTGVNGAPRVSSGTWTRDDQANELVLSVDGEPVAYNFEYRSDAVLVLRAQTPGGFFDNLLFRRTH